MKSYVSFVNSFAVKSYFYEFKLFEVCWDPQNFKDNFHLVALTNQWDSKCNVSITEYTEPFQSIDACFGCFFAKFQV